MPPMRAPRLAPAPLCLLAAAALLALVLLLGLRTAGESASAAPRQPPNFVVIQTDDQTLATLRAVRVTPLGNRVRAMPNTLDLIRKHGISFNRYIASYPLCCPSRSTLLSGRYAAEYLAIGLVND